MSSDHDFDAEVKAALALEWAKFTADMHGKDAGKEWTKLESLMFGSGFHCGAMWALERIRVKL